MTILAAPAITPGRSRCARAHNRLRPMGGRAVRPAAQGSTRLGDEGRWDAWM